MTVWQGLMESDQVERELLGDRHMTYTSRTLEAKQTVLNKCALSE